MSGELPKVGTQVKTFVKATKKFVASGGQVTSKPVRAKRWTICEQCYKFIPESKRCAACGCFIKVKILLATEQCPIHLWGQEVKGLKPKTGCKGCGR